jgi:Alpha/beta hydrolase domain
VPMRSALMRSFIAWVTTGAAMPASTYPRISDGTLVTPTRGAMGFPNIPGRPSPEGVIHPLLDYDLGTSFTYRDRSGVLTQIPSVKQSLPQLVPTVDADGNEIAGVKSPLEMAPLGTYTGWNAFSSGVFKGQMCIVNAPVGGFMPFATTQVERLASGDPRMSLEERYGTHDGYVKAVTAAANALVTKGFLLRAAADAMIAQAEASRVLR